MNLEQQTAAPSRVNDTHSALLLSDNDILRVYRAHARSDGNWVGPFARDILSQVRVWARRANRPTREWELTDAKALELSRGYAVDELAPMSAQSFARFLESLMLRA